MNRLHTFAMLRYSLRCRAVRLALGALLMAALCCLAIALAWWAPVRREHEQLARTIDAARQARLSAARLQDAARAEQQVRPTVLALERKLQTHAGQADLIQGIARLAAHRGVRVVSQAFDEGKPQADLRQPLYLDLGLVGDYAALRHLSADLATLPMWIEILEERLELSAPGSTQVRAQLRLLTYRNGRELP